MSGSEDDTKKKFTIPVTKSAMIDGLGQVEIAWITIGDESDAEEFILGLDPKDQPRAFANFILHRIIRNPTLTFEEVEALTNDQVRAIVSIAGSIGGESEYFDSEADDARQALFEAIQTHREASRVQLASTIQAVARPYNAVFESLDKQTEWIQSLAASGAMNPMIKLNPFAMTVEALSALSLDQINQLTQLSAASSIINASIASDCLEQISGIRNVGESILANVSGLGSKLHISESFIDSEPWLTASSAIFLSLQGLPENLVGLSNSGLLGASTSWATEFTMGSALFGAIESSSNLADVLTHRGLSLAGLYPDYIHTPTYSEPDLVFIENDENLETALLQEQTTRRRRCQDILFEFEQQLRSFVENQLTELAGQGWWRQRVPGEIKNVAQQLKNLRETGNANRLHPIHYLTLGQLVEVILTSNNWAEAFESVFRKQDHLRTLFYYISVVRNDVDHARYPDNASYFRFAVSINTIYEHLGLPELVVMAEVIE